MAISDLAKLQTIDSIDKTIAKFQARIKTASGQNQSDYIDVYQDVIKQLEKEKKIIVTDKPASDSEGRDGIDSR